MQASQLPPLAILQWGSVHEGADMGTMYQSPAVLGGLQTIKRFLVLVTKLGDALNPTPGRPLLDGLLQIDELLSVRQTFPAMDGYMELFPELLPVQHLTNECRDAQLGNLGETLTISGRVPGERGTGVE